MGYSNKIYIRKLHITYGRTYGTWIMLKHYTDQEKKRLDIYTNTICNII